jgi:hypothetical protein
MGHLELIQQELPPRSDGGFSS